MEQLFIISNVNIFLNNLEKRLGLNNFTPIIMVLPVVQLGIHCMQPAIFTVVQHSYPQTLIASNNSEFFSNCVHNGNSQPLDVALSTA